MTNRFRQIGTLDWLQPKKEVILQIWLFIIILSSLYYVCPSDYSSHSSPSFSRQQVFSRNNSHLLVLAFSVSVLAWPQALGQTKDEPSEGTQLSYQAHKLQQPIQHNRLRPSPLSDAIDPNMLCTNDFLSQLSSYKVLPSTRNPISQTCGFCLHLL